MDILTLGPIKFSFLFLAQSVVLQALCLARCKKELQKMREQELDVTQFEANLAAFTDNIENNHRLASENFAAAIAEIDKAIAALEQTKEDLLTTEKKLELADKKAIFLHPCFVFR